jgi:hypothetical protein
MRPPANDDDFDPTGGERPYRIGTKVTWDDTGDYWRVEIVGALDDVGGVLIPAEMMADIVDEETTDPARMAGLIMLFKDDIEHEIAVCAMEHFEPEMGIIPLGKSEKR